MAQEKFSDCTREKIEGFVLLVGTGQTVIEAGSDRDLAVEKAKEIVDSNDTIVFVSKLQSKFGEAFITKDQLILTRKFEN